MPHVVERLARRTPAGRRAGLADLVSEQQRPQVGCVSPARLADAVSERRRRLGHVRHAGRRRRSRGRRLRDSARRLPLSASRRRRAGARVVAAAGRHGQAARAHVGARACRPARQLRLLAGEPAARQGHRGVHAARSRASSACGPRTIGARSTTLFAPITDRRSNGCRSNRPR